MFGGVEECLSYFLFVELSGELVSFCFGGFWQSLFLFDEKKKLTL